MDAQLYTQWFLTCMVLFYGGTGISYAILHTVEKFLLKKEK